MSHVPLHYNEISRKQNSLAQLVTNSSEEGRNQAEPKSETKNEKTPSWPWQGFIDACTVPFTGGFADETSFNITPKIYYHVPLTTFAAAAAAAAAADSNKLSVSRMRKKEGAQQARTMESWEEQTSPRHLLPLHLAKLRKVSCSVGFYNRYAISDTHIQQSDARTAARHDGVPRRKPGVRTNTPSQRSNPPERKPRYDHKALNTKQSGTKSPPCTMFLSILRLFSIFSCSEKLQQAIPESLFPS
eukprot:2499699-Rhodomonas_salina.1